MITFPLRVSSPVNARLVLKFLCLISPRRAITMVVPQLVPSLPLELSPKWIWMLLLFQVSNSYVVKYLSRLYSAT